MRSGVRRTLDLLLAGLSLYRFLQRCILYIYICIRHDGNTDTLKTYMQTVKKKKKKKKEMYIYKIVTQKDNMQSYDTTEKTEYVIDLNTGSK